MVRNKFLNGFTLIEIIIVVAIIILFSGLSLVYYNNFNEQTKLKEEARKLVDVLELAKKKASSGDTPTSCEGGFNGYRVDVNANSYSLSSCCGGICNTTSPVTTYNLPTSLTTYAGTGYIQYSQLNLAINMTISSPIKIKNSSLSNSANCLEINITSNGIVTNDDQFKSCP